MRMYLENGEFDFDSKEKYEKIGSVLYCNSPYIRDLVKFLWERG